MQYITKLLHYVKEKSLSIEELPFDLGNVQILNSFIDVLVAMKSNELLRSLLAYGEWGLHFKCYIKLGPCYLDLK